jgi:DNA-binding NarL/FixJ family response regulator
MAIRIVVADDHPIVLHGINQLLRGAGGIDVVASCATGEDTLVAVREHRPDVLVLDLRLPGQSGMDVLRTLSAEHTTCKTVLLTAAVGDAEIAEALQLGVVGLVLKDSAPNALVDAVRAVYAGEQRIDQERLSRALRALVDNPPPAAPRKAALTRREIEIVQMIALGLRNRAIAEKLAISEGTVKVHLHNIYEKFGVDGRLELVLCAQQQGLV